MVRCCIGFGPILTRRSRRKLCIVVRHDGLLQFGRGFDGCNVLLVEVGETAFDFGAHGYRFPDVLVLRLEDGDAVIDDGLLLKPGALFACGVFRQDGFRARGDKCATVDGAERETADRA